MACGYTYPQALAKVLEEASGKGAWALFDVAPPHLTSAEYQFAKGPTNLRANICLDRRLNTDMYCVTSATIRARAAGAATARDIVHAIASVCGSHTRLVLGNAQENKVVTVDSLAAWSSFSSNRIVAPDGHGIVLDAFLKTNLLVSAFCNAYVELTCTPKDVHPDIEFFVVVNTVEIVPSSETGIMSSPVTHVVRTATIIKDRACESVTLPLNGPISALLFDLDGGPVENLAVTMTLTNEKTLTIHVPKSGMVPTANGVVVNFADLAATEDPLVFQAGRGENQQGSESEDAFARKRRFWSL
jgi:hypothetical protein